MKKPLNMSDPTDKWILETFVEKSADGGYFFNDSKFSKILGEPTDLESATEYEHNVLNEFLQLQIQTGA